MNTNIKSRQFCSVCKEWLDMEVVPSSGSGGDEDDGVIWFRCPRCQGFLPKLSGTVSEAEPEPGAVAEDDSPVASGDDSAVAEVPAPDPGDDAMPWNSPADMMADLAGKDGEPGEEEEDDDPLLGGVGIEEIEEHAGKDDEVLDNKAGQKDGQESPEAEPIMEYAALLAEKDVDEAVPYRHWGTYSVGQCIHHLAWDDCGVVVAKEELPGGRQVIKVYFEEAGVVRLIEQAPR